MRKQPRKEFAGRGVSRDVLRVFKNERRSGNGRLPSLERQIDPFGDAGAAIAQHELALRERLRPRRRFQCKRRHQPAGEIQIVEDAGSIANRRSSSPAYELTSERAFPEARGRD